MSDLSIIRDTEPDNYLALLMRGRLRKALMQARGIEAHDGRRWADRGWASDEELEWAFLAAHRSQADLAPHTLTIIRAFPRESI